MRTETSPSRADVVVPHSLEAERAVLGVVLVDHDRLLEVPELEVKHFFRAAHQTIFAAMREMSEKRRAIDVVTLRDWLTRSGQLEDVGGTVYLASLGSGVPRTTNITHYAGIVRADAQRRKLIQTAERLRDMALSAEEDPDAILALAERELFEASQRADRGDFISAADLIAQGFPLIEQVINDRPSNGVTGLATGFYDLDESTHGLHPGQLILIAGRPGMGKTAFALNVALHIAKAGKSVGFFSLEMSRTTELLRRLLSAEARIDSHRLQSGWVNQSEMLRLWEARELVAGTGLHIDDTPVLSLMEMRGKLRRLRARVGLDLVVLDYLQLMEMPKAEKDYIAIGHVSRGLKQLARELEVPVVALSQLSRENEKRSDHKPLLSDLRGSGSLEQDADVVLFLHRPEVYDPKPENYGLAELVVAKQRNGRMGSIELQWFGELTKFESRVSA